jgi:hypothetical protein
MIKTGASKKNGPLFKIGEILNLPTFAADLVPGFKAGIKREVRCKSGAIPVAVRIVSGEL